MNDTNDSLNAQVEREKLTIEHEKTRIARNSFRVDVVAKIVVPLVVATLALYGVLHRKDDDRTALPAANPKPQVVPESQHSTSGPSARQEPDMEHTKLPFIQGNLAVITNGTDQEVASLKANAATRFTRSDDLNEVISMIDNLRQSSATRHTQIDTQLAEPEVQNQPSMTRASPQEADRSAKVMIDYAVDGQKELVAGNFEQAVVNYLLAAKSTPSDPSLWNSLAYAQLRAGQAKEAYDSIVRAAALHPTSPRTQNYVAINATKILCALGRKQEALGYLNQQLSQLPTLQERVTGDAEINRYCG